MGAADPTSGSVCIHEVVRGLGVLLKQGWKPLRTIILASWDAEEVSSTYPYGLMVLTNLIIQYGLIGSTEWGEDFADWIQAHVVAYLNLGKFIRIERYIR
jgi:N-acetylated-alpha-linked acidic dipeptidase